MTTQLVIDALRDEVASNGEIVYCGRASGFALDRVYKVTFENGVTRFYWMRAGVPVMMTKGENDDRHDDD